MYSDAEFICALLRFLYLGFDSPVVLSCLFWKLVFFICICLISGSVLVTCWESIGIRISQNVLRSKLYSLTLSFKNNTIRWSVDYWWQFWVKPCALAQEAGYLVSPW